jgi:ribosomal protein S18 acetylase RimI-like enzyme
VLENQQAIFFTLLDKHHDRAAFSSGEPSLDHYLQKQASQDIKRRAAAVYVMTEEPEASTILGYYTLSAAGVLLEELPEEAAKKLSRYPQVGAILLGRLAVDDRYKGQGLGAQLLRYALLQSLEQSRQVAAAVVIVDALNESAQRFYEKYGFTLLPGQPEGYPTRLFIPMRTLEQAL